MHKTRMYLLTTSYKQGLHGTETDLYPEQHLTDVKCSGLESALSSMCATRKLRSRVAS